MKRIRSGIRNMNTIYLIKCRYCGSNRKWASSNNKLVGSTALCFCCNKKFKVYNSVNDNQIISEMVVKE